MTAGTAPPSLIAARQRSSASALAGDGKPRLEKIVDSSATTGRPSASAPATSSDSRVVITTTVCLDSGRSRRSCGSRMHESRHALDVMRMRKQVEHLGAVVSVSVSASSAVSRASATGSQLTSASTGASVADQRADARPAEPRTGRVGDRHVELDTASQVATKRLTLFDTMRRDPSSWRGNHRPLTSTSRP